MSEDTINVAVRVRPKLPKESSLSEHFVVNNGEIMVSSSMQDPYTFDHIFDSLKKNSDVYEVIKPLVKSATEGINGCIFAYGQTSSGKTHSLMGANEEKGIILLAIEDIFKIIKSNPNRKFFLRGSYIEIYNEKIVDLLNPKEETNLKIREDLKGNLFLPCKEFLTRSEKELYGILLRGNKCRQIEETKMNERSSRSHAIFKIVIESMENCESDEAEVPGQVSSLHFIDLAGSERPTQTQAHGARLKEGGHINKTLSTLALVIRQLSENQEFVSFRDSKLTRLLSNCLGGNSKTLILATITPTFLEDSISTLNFAKLAKRIKVKPKVNEVLTSNTILKKFKRIETDLKLSKDKISALQEEKEKYLNKIHQMEEARQSYLLNILHNSDVEPLVVKPINRRHTLGIEQPAKSSSGNIYPSLTRKSIMFKKEDSNYEYLSAFPNVEEYYNTPAVNNEQELNFKLKLLNDKYLKEKETNEELQKKIVELKAKSNTEGPSTQRNEKQRLFNEIDSNRIIIDLQKGLGSLHEIIMTSEPESSDSNKCKELGPDDLNNTITNVIENNNNCDTQQHNSYHDNEYVLLNQIHEQLSRENNPDVNMEEVINKIQLYLSFRDGEKNTLTENLKSSNVLISSLQRDINCLNMKVQELVNANIHLSKSNQNHYEENKILKTKISFLEKSSSINHETSNTDKDTVHEQNLKKQIDDLTQEKYNLELKLQSNEIENLKNEGKSIDCKCLEYQIENENLMKMINPLNTEIVDLQKILIQVQEENKSLQYNLDVNLKKVNELSEESSAYKNKLFVLKEKLALVEESALKQSHFINEINLLEDALKTKNKELEDICKDYKNKLAYITELETLNKTMLKDTKELEEKSILVEDLLLQKNRFRNEINVLEDALKIKNQEFEDIQNDYQSKLVYITELESLNNQMLKDAKEREELKENYVLVEDLVLQQNCFKNQINLLEDSLKKKNQELEDIRNDYQSKLVYITELESLKDKILIDKKELEEKSLLVGDLVLQQNRFKNQINLLDDSLKQKNQELEDIRNDYQSKLVYITELESLKDKILIDTKELKEKSLLVEDLVLQQNRFKNQINLLEDSLKQKTQELEDIRTDYQIKLVCITELESLKDKILIDTKELKEKSLLEDSLKEKNQQLKDIGKNYESKLVYITELESSKGELLKEIKEMEKIVAELRTTVIKSLSRNSNLERDLHTSSIELKGKVMELKSSHDMNDNLKEKLSRYEKYVKELESEKVKLGLLKDELDTKEAQIKALMTENRSIKAELNNLGLRTKELNKIIFNKEKVMENLETNYKEEIQNLALQAKKICQFIDSNYEQNKILNKISLNSYKVMPLEEKVAFIVKDFKDLNKNSVEMDKKITYLNDELLKKETKISENFGFIKNLFDKFPKKNSICDFNDLKIFLSSNIDDLLKNVISLQEEINKMNIKTSEKEKKIMKLEESLKDHKEKNRLLVLETDKLLKKLVEANSNYEEAMLEKSSELENLKFKLNHAETKQNSRVNNLNKELSMLKGKLEEINQELFKNKTELALVNFELDRSRVSLQDMESLKVELLLKMKNLMKYIEENNVLIENFKMRKTCNSPDKNSLNSKQTSPRQVLQENVRARRTNIHDDRRGLLLVNDEIGKEDRKISYWEKSNNILKNEIINLEKLIKMDNNLELEDNKMVKQKAIEKVKTTAMERITDLSFLIDDLLEKSKTECSKCSSCLQLLNQLKTEIDALRSNLLDNSGCNMMDSENVPFINLMRKLMECISSNRDINIRNIFPNVISCITNLENKSSNLKSEDNNRTYFILKVMDKLENIKLDEQEMVAPKSCNCLCSKRQLILNLISRMKKRLKRTINFTRYLNSNYQSLSKESIKINEDGFHNDDIKISKLVQELLGSDSVQTTSYDQLKEKYELLKIISEDRRLQLNKLTQENERLRNEPRQKLISEVQKLKLKFNSENSRNACLDPLEAALAISNPSRKDED